MTHAIRARESRPWVPVTSSLVSATRGPPAPQHCSRTGRAEADASVDPAHAATGPDTIAKFCSRRDRPHSEAFINTHRALLQPAMLTPCPGRRDPLFSRTSRRDRGLAPWTHNYGGQSHVTWCLARTAHPSTTAIATPPCVPRPCAICAEIAPTSTTTSPKGYEKALVPASARHKGCATPFFNPRESSGYAGAILNQPTWMRCVSFRSKPAANVSGFSRAWDRPNLALRVCLSPRLPAAGHHRRAAPSDAVSGARPRQARGSVRAEQPLAIGGMSTSRASVSNRRDITSSVTR